MRWQSFEDRTCCAIFVKNHVFAAKSLVESIQEATKNGVDKSEGSIRMKFGNIATLCDVYGITVLTKMGRLSNYSKQSLIEFESIVNLLGSKEG
jgi:hypothetical protein